MALVYRSMWTDDLADIVEVALATFRTWVDGKTDGEVVLPETGFVAGTVPAGPRHDRASAVADVEVWIDHRDAPGADVDHALRASMVEARDDGSRWTTTLRAWSGPACRLEDGGAGWLWVDVEVVSDEPAGLPVVRPPRLVTELLKNGARPRRRGLLLSPEVHRYEGPDGAQNLADEITHLDRLVPIAVFSQVAPQLLRTLQVHASAADTAVRLAAKYLAGVTAVAWIDDDAREALPEILGSVGFSVGSGDVRLYLPGLDPAMPVEDEAWRHPVLAPRQYLRGDKETAFKRLFRTIAPRAITRRAPTTYDAAKTLLRAAPPDVDALELLELAEAEVDDLRVRLAEQQEQHRSLLDDNAELSATVAFLQWRLEQAERAGPTEQATSAIPVSAAGPGEAYLLATEFLSERLVIPGAACVELDLLDSAVESAAWGNSCWRGLRALHAYAEHLAAGHSIDFWTWCATSKHPRVWPATDKKLAMRESEQVMSRAKWRNARLLPVATTVDPSGRIEMQAHLKIAEGGGMLAPRIYFHVDQAASLVHVGFFGPHKHMPNTKT